ncbi:unnamed protein product [Darwinula stevensoni]|uniref:ISXO2-like transposase domain-containing protein n=1 Tax=Darwinula stevensoni TaxID=69355 RepID=A0A7R8XB92_9CRUS|nr:unnamed protein product [Darwinula stevensoni]CAG0886250.1 unnamed protein product [Darwinula stevensoni]
MHLERGEDRWRGENRGVGRKFGRRKYHRGHHVEGLWGFGGVERGTGRCFHVPVKERNSETLFRLIRIWVCPGTLIMTDCWAAYDISKSQPFKHLTVNHKLEFVNQSTDPPTHTNTIEGMWRHAKDSENPKEDTEDDSSSTDLIQPFPKWDSSMEGCLNGIPWPAASLL